MGGKGNFLPKDEVMEDGGFAHHMTDSCVFYAMRNTALVDLYIGPTLAVRITGMPRVTFVQQLSNIGTCPYNLVFCSTVLCTVLTVLVDVPSPLVRSFNFLINIPY